MATMQQRWMPDKTALSLVAYASGNGRFRDGRPSPPLYREDASTTRVRNQRRTSSSIAGLCDRRRMGHLLGYARVSTANQQAHLQVDALEQAGCYRVIIETASGAVTDRPVLEQVLDQLRPGDTLVVRWLLYRDPDRLPEDSLRHDSRPIFPRLAGLARKTVGVGHHQQVQGLGDPGRHNQASRSGQLLSLGTGDRLAAQPAGQTAHR